MYTFVGYRNIKGKSAKTQKDYDFNIGYFLTDIPEGQSGEGAAVYQRFNRFPSVATTFIDTYPIGSTFTDLVFNSAGEIIGGEQ